MEQQDLRDQKEMMEAQEIWDQWATQEQTHRPTPNQVIKDQTVNQDH
jgi:hypothetical protein